MSYSKLVNYTDYSEHYSAGRGGKEITHICLHHMAGNLSVEQCGNVFHNKETSTHYGIDNSGRIGQYVSEDDTAWAVGDFDMNQRSISIECANCGGDPDWNVSDLVVQRAIDLITDICVRLGWTYLSYTGDLNGDLIKHCFVVNTNCPGPTLGSKFEYIANEVTKRLSGGGSTPSDNYYRVQIGASKDKAEAETKMKKVQAKGFDCILKEIDGYYKIQLRAYKNKADADEMAEKVSNAGFDCFVSFGGGSCGSAKKSVDEIADEVIKGLWGNGQERLERLTAAGYDYDAVQARVNALF